MYINAYDLNEFIDKQVAELDELFTIYSHKNNKDANRERLIQIKKEKEAHLKYKKFIFDHYSDGMRQLIEKQCGDVSYYH